MAAADHRGVVIGVISLDVLHHQLVLHLLAADRALYHVVHLRLGRAAPAAPAVGTAALADVGGELSLMKAHQVHLERADQVRQRRQNVFSAEQEHIKATVAASTHPESVGDLCLQPQLEVRPGDRISGRIQCRRRADNHRLLNVGIEFSHASTVNGIKYNSETVHAVFQMD